jgi:DNA (cytosine-5)-methyltransferase 1
MSANPEILGESGKALAILAAARIHHTQADLARQLGVDARTIRRWETRETEPPPYLVHALQRLLPYQFSPSADDAAFRFIDLFAGIGGIRLAFEEIGGECVFTSEWDTYAQKTYAANFPGGHQIAGDITRIHEGDVPDHDVLLAGFPCQPFSIAGVSKKNALGRAHGFADETQGTLFFDVARVIAARRPRAFLLENVKNLQSHDRGNTFAVIVRTLRDELGYDIHWRVIDGAHFVPQHRERIIIVGFRDPTPFDWNALRLPEKGSVRLGSILHKTDGSEPELPWDEGRFVDPANGRVHDKYTLTDHLWRYLQDYAAKHKAKGNGFGFGLVGPEAVTRTLSARYYKDGSEILVKQRGRKNPRRLTPRECARLMGFPDTYRIPVSDTRAYKQYGNSVVVPVVREVARVMKQFIHEENPLQAELLMRA